MRQVSSTLIFIVIALQLGFGVLWIATGADAQRRPHFWARIVLASLALPALVALLVAIARLNLLPDDAERELLPLLFFLGVVALLFVPGLLYRWSGSPPGSSDSDDGGGGGPERPRTPDGPRGGGIPLLDAEQATARARDHSGPRFEKLRRRRPADVPDRTPVQPRALCLSDPG